MDPNAALETIRAASNELDALTEPDRGFDVPTEILSAAADLTESVFALDEWITKGGFLPTAWTPTPAPEPFVPYKDRPALDKGPVIVWRELESGMLFKPGISSPSIRRVRGTPMPVHANGSYIIGSEDPANGRPCGGVEGTDSDIYDRSYLPDGRPLYTVRGFYTHEADVLTAGHTVTVTVESDHDHEAVVADIRHLIEGAASGSIGDPSDYDHMSAVTVGPDRLTQLVAATRTAYDALIEAEIDPVDVYAALAVAYAAHGLDADVAESSIDWLEGDTLRDDLADALNRTPTNPTD